MPIRSAVAAVQARGHTAATVDLSLPAEQLREALDAVLDGRAPAVVMALDSLEHLPAPEVVLGVVRSLAGGSEGRGC